MITAKINLALLKHGIVKGKTEGEMVICIPIKANSLFHSEKGNVYLDLVGFERKNVEENGDTHLLKQSFSKEEREKMTEEQRKSLPIIGNARVTSSGQYSEPEPNNVTPGEVAEDVDGLPF